MPIDRLHMHLGLLYGWRRSAFLPFADSKTYNSRYDLESAGIDLAPLGSPYGVAVAEGVRRVFARALWIQRASK
jgi:hypothetical protein